MDGWGGSPTYLTWREGGGQGQGGSPACLARAEEEQGISVTYLARGVKRERQDRIPTYLAFIAQ